MLLALVTPRGLRCRALAPGLFALAVLASIETAAADPIVAKALFKKGLDAARRGDYKHACQFFRDSYKNEVTVGTHYKLGECEEKLGKVASAWQHYRSVIEELDGKPGAARSDRLKDSKTKAAELEPQVPWLTVKLVRGAPGGTTVKRDGVEIDKAILGVAQPIDPGKYRLVVTAPGYEEKRYPVIVDVGAQKTLTVGPGLPVPEPEKLPSQPKAEPGHAPTPGWIMAGGGLALAGVGATLILLSLGDVADADEAQKQADRSTGDTKQKFVTQAFDATTRANTKQWIGGVGMGVGVGVAGFGIYWALTAQTKPKGESVELSVIPSADRCIAGARLKWRF